jgi:hypothetical protein
MVKKSFRLERCLEYREEDGLTGGCRGIDSSCISGLRDGNGAHWSIGAFEGLRA